MSAMLSRQMYAIDASRVCVKKPDDPHWPYDRSVPDAVWVPVVGPDMECVTSADARNDANRFVAERYGGADGQDASEPPVPDDGRVLPRAVTDDNTPAARVTMTASDYLRAASQQQLAPSGTTRYVAFYRIRRLGLV